MDEGNEILLLAVQWMELEDIMLSEINQTWKDKCIFLSNAGARNPQREYGIVVIRDLGGVMWIVGVWIMDTRSVLYQKNEILVTVVYNNL